MSFLTTLGNDLKIAGKAVIAAAPFIGGVVSLYDPPLGMAITGIAGKIESAIVTAETNIPGDGAGAQKQANVIDDWTSALALASTITGEKYIWDEAKLKEAIAASVAAKNAMSAFVSTVKKA